MLPLCYGIFCGVKVEQWLYERFKRRFEDIDKFLEWAGESTRFGGGEAM